jgi:hypothetical protein
MMMFLFIRFMRWFYRLPQRVYQALRYRLIESTHRASVAWSTREGVTTAKRNPELIVSLTTIPERISKVALCLDSLLRQSLKPDRLILWLSECNEPNRPLINQASLPSDLLRLIPRGLEIRWCKDIRSFRKIIPTLHAHPTALVVTADDDVFYPRHWLKELYDAYQIEPQYVHCHRAHQILYDSAGVALPYNQWNMMANGEQGPSFDLFPTGVGGVLYAPGQLHPDILNEETFLALCPKADDVWLKAMSLLANVPCKKVASKSYAPMEIRIPNNLTLSSENVTLNGNDPQIRAVCGKYGVFQKNSGGLTKLSSDCDPSAILSAIPTNTPNERNLVRFRKNRGKPRSGS